MLIRKRTKGRKCRRAGNQEAFGSAIRSSNENKATKAELIRRNVFEGGFELEAEGFAVGRGGFAGDVDGRGEEKFDAGKREGNLEAVPAVEPDFPAGMIGDGNDGAAGELGEGDDAFLRDIGGTARAVGRDGEVAVAAGPGGEFAEGLGSAAAGGTADGLDAEAFEDAGEKTAVAAGTDHGGESGAAVAPADVAEVDEHGKGEAVVPDAVDGGAGRWVAGEPVGAVGPAAAKGGAEEAEQEIKEGGDEALVPAGLVGDDDL
jgi:hypothetical protein